MWKWVSRAIRTGATAVLLSFLCVWTTGYIVNSYLQAVVRQLELPLEVPPLSPHSLWGVLWGADPSLSAAGRELPRDTPDISAASMPPAASAAADEPPPDNGGEPGSRADSEEAMALPADEPNGGDGALGASSADDSDSPAPDGIAPDGTAETDAGGMTTEQRRELYADVVARLSADELNRLSAALQDGLTEEELTAIETMLRHALPPEQLEQFMGQLTATAPWGMPEEP